MNVTKEQLLSTNGTFTWFFGQDWFIQTDLGNFHWKDPSYQGDNTVAKFEGSYEDFCKFINVDFGRAKGIKMISLKCGEEFELIP